MRALILLTAVLLAGKASATGEINVLTDLFSPFPPGCVALSLPTGPASDDNVIWDVDELVPAAGSSVANNPVRIQIWRVGCADEGYSVVMVRLTNLGDQVILVPRAFVDTEIVDGFLWHEAQLISFPAVGNVGAAGNVMPGNGQTFMLGADPQSLLENRPLFGPEDYNDEFLLELFWEAFAPDAPPIDLFPIDAYVPAWDPPQFDTPLLHGRMNGAYVFESNPSAGLFLNVGEQLSEIGGELVDTNFVFAAFFSYRNGEPFWSVGSTGPQAPGIGTVTLNMLAYSGGEFIRNPPTYSEADLNEESIGTLRIEVVDCNTLQIDYDFRQANMGQNSLRATRLVRTAGYDCNPWQ